MAVLRLRHLHGKPAKGEFRLPFGPTIPVLAFVLIGWLLWQLTAEETIALTALVGVSVLIYVSGTVARRILRARD